VRRALLLAESTDTSKELLDLVVTELAFARRHGVIQARAGTFANGGD